MRRVVVVALCTFFAALVGARPAAAHGGAVLTVHGDGRGAVWVTAQFSDGHPIIGGAVATLLATAATGERIGPTALRPVGDVQGTLSFGSTLGPGVWQVIAEMAAPAIGRCTATVTVVAADAPAAPSQVRCGDVSAPPEPEPDRAAPPAQPDGSRWWFIAAAVLVPLAAVAVFVLRSGRPRRR